LIFPGFNINQNERDHNPMGFYKFLAFILLFVSCNVFDQAEDQPAYVSIQSVRVEDPEGNSFSSHAVLDLWSYLDAKNLGVYPYPSHIACLPENERSNLSFVGGIRENGIASSVSIYPMLNPIEMEIELLPGENYPLDLSFNYRSDVILRLDQGFESAVSLFDFDADEMAETEMIKVTEKSKSGNASGKIVVPDSLEFVEVASSEAFIGIPTDGRSVYLELDYLSEADLFIGVIGYQDEAAETQPLKSYYLGLLPNEEWEKIYVNLTEVMFTSKLKAYRILFRAENNGSGVDEATYLDNLKLLHF
jgi:hypothetical protein